MPSDAATAVPRAADAGLLHAGGTLQDAALQHQTVAGMRAVMAPKISGITALLRASSASPFSHATLFSSIASVTGPAGSTNYAAANAVLDATADNLRLHGTVVHCSAMLP